MNQNNWGRHRANGATPIQLSKNPESITIIGLERSKIRFITGNVSPLAANASNTLRTLASVVTEIDLTSLPCECTSDVFCMSCAAFDARARARDLRQRGQR